MQFVRASVFERVKREAEERMEILNRAQAELAEARQRVEQLEQKLDALSKSKEKKEVKK